MMANEIDGTVKIKNQDVETALGYLGERINDVFTNMKATKISDTESNYTGGKGIELFGISANAKISSIDGEKTLLKVQAKPKATAFTIAFCVIVALMNLLIGMEFGVPLFLIVIVIAILGRSQVNKKIARLINDVNIRFS